MTKTRTEILISGFGGQGVVRMGQILGLCAINQGHRVTMLKSHGTETRGGYVRAQIVISPGMLKRQGWSWDEKYPAQIVRKVADEKTGRPLSFGTAKDKKRRGASDHFPVTVRLHVAGSR